MSSKFLRSRRCGCNCFSIRGLEEKYFLIVQLVFSFLNKTSVVSYKTYAVSHNIGFMAN